MMVVLIYNIEGYCCDGGGTYAEYFEDQNKMIDRVNELNKEHSIKFHFGKAIEFHNEIRIEEVDRITEYKIR